MKIYDIISEAPAIAPAAAPVVAPTTPTPSKLTKAKAAISKSSKLVDRYILTKKLHGTVVTNRMAGALGTYLRIIKWLGFYEIATQLWQQKIAIEGLVAEKQISKEDGQALIRQQYEKMAVAIMATAAFAKLIGMLKYIPVVKWFVRLAAGAAAGATLGALGGPAIIFALATEVGLIFLTKYLQTEDGQKALAFWVVSIIDPGVVWLWNEGPGKIFGAWKTASEEGQNAAAKTIKGKDSNSSNQAANPVAGPAAGAAVPAKAAIDATSTDQDPMAAALNLKTDDVLKANEKKWGVGNAAFPKGNTAKFVDQSELNSKAPR